MVEGACIEPGGWRPGAAEPALAIVERSGPTSCASSPVPFAALIEKLLDARALIFGSGAVHVLAEQSLRRPSSQVLRLRVESGPFVSHVYLKRNHVAAPSERLRQQGAVVDDFVAQHRAFEALRHLQGLAAARPIVCFPSALSVATEGARGQTLDVVIRRATAGGARTRARALESVVRVGHWLRAWHRAGAAPGCIDPRCCGRGSRRASAPWWSSAEPWGPPSGTARWVARRSSSIGCRAGRCARCRYTATSAPRT